MKGQVNLPIFPKSCLAKARYMHRFSPVESALLFCLLMLLSIVLVRFLIFVGWTKTKLPSSSGPTCHTCGNTPFVPEVCPPLKPEQVRVVLDSTKRGNIHPVALNSHSLPLNVKVNKERALKSRFVVGSIVLTLLVAVYITMAFCMQVMKHCGDLSIQGRRILEWIFGFHFTGMLMYGVFGFEFRSLVDVAQQTINIRNK